MMYTDPAWRKWALALEGKAWRKFRNRRNMANAKMLYGMTHVDARAGWMKGRNAGMIKISCICRASSSTRKANILLRSRQSRRDSAPPQDSSRLKSNAIANRSPQLNIVGMFSSRSMFRASSQFFPAPKWYMPACTIKWARSSKTFIPVRTLQTGFGFSAKQGGWLFFLLKV